jgi:outer membrane protein assembly factor BamA
MRIASLILFFFISIQFCQASMDDDTLPHGISSRILIFPFVLRSPETSWGFGAVTAFFFKTKKDEPTLRTSDLNIVGLYTLEKQTVIVLGSTIFFSGEKKIFRFQSSYSNYPDKTWGIGNSTPESASEDYTYRQMFFNPQLLFKIYNSLFIGASMEMQNISEFNYNHGGVFDEQQINGKQGGFASGAGLLLTWDTRNNAYSPSHGMFAEINATHFGKALGSDFHFQSYLVDIRKFLPAGRNRVLGFQSLAKVNIGEAPIRYLAMIGGTEMMRGYYKGRFTDDDMFAVQTELRQYLFWRLGVVGFASLGQVSDYVKYFGLNEFHFAYGAGLRLVLQEREKLNLRVDFGFGKNSSGVYVLLKEAF